MVVEEGRSLGMGAVMGLFNSSMDWGMIIGPLVGGLIFDYLDLPPVFYFGGLMGLLGVMVFGYLTRSGREGERGGGG